MRHLYLLTLLALISTPSYADTTSLIGVFNQDNVGTNCAGYNGPLGSPNQVNQLCTIGATTGNAVTLTAASSIANGGLGLQDTNVSLNITPNGSGTVNVTNLAPTGTVPTQSIRFSVIESGNPLMLVTDQQVPIASVNTAGGYNFISGVTGRTVYPSALTVMAYGGTAAGAFGINISCTSGNILLSAVVSSFVSGVPLTFMSAPGTAIPVGCAAGDGVFISRSGTSNVTTATGFFVNMPYTVQ